MRFIATTLLIDSDQRVKRTHAGETGQNQNDSNISPCAHVSLNRGISEPDSAKNSDKAVDAMYVLFQHVFLL